MQIITADQAGALIQDRATIFLGGLGMGSLAEEVLQGLERQFLASGHPQQLTTWACGAIGNSGDGGMKHFAHKGMIKRVIILDWELGINRQPDHRAIALAR